MKTGGGLYDLLAKCTGLPPSRTLRRYSTHTSTVQDGIMYENLSTAEQEFIDSHPDCPTKDFKRHVSLALDEMHTKGRFGVNMHTNELVGVSNDAFERSVIELEL